MKLKAILILFILITTSVQFIHSVNNVESDVYEYSRKAEPLRIESGKVFLNNIKLSPKEVQKVLEYNPAALSKYKAGRTLEITGLVIGVPCAFVFGWDLGSRLWGTGNNTMLIAGGAGTAFGLILGLVGSGQCKAAINLYNSGIEKRDGYSLNCGVTSDGIGFTLAF